MNNHSQRAVNFYQEQSVFSNPSAYAYLFDELSVELASVKKIVQGLFLHFLDAKKFSYAICAERLLEIDLRYLTVMLEKLMHYDHRVLSTERLSEQRVIVSCREFSLLACSILRHHGVAARLRVAFNNVLYRTMAHDQIVLEYWDQTNCAWSQADFRFTQAQLDAVHGPKDCFHLSKAQYIPAAVAWQRIRKNKDDAAHYGGLENRGLWYVRDRLIQDLAALNKMEMLIWDCWGMMEIPENELCEMDLLLLDEVAELLLEPDKNFSSIQRCYQHELLRVPSCFLSISPASGKQMVSVDCCV